MLDLDFLQGFFFVILVKKWPFHGVTLHFLTETSPSFQQIAIHIYLKRFPELVVQELRQCHTLSQGLLCVLKATFSKECHTLLKATLCIHVKTIVIFQEISYSELCYLKIMLYFSIWTLFLLSKENCPTPLFKPIYFMNFHEIIKYSVKGMPHSWTTNVYMFNFLS